MLDNRTVNQASSLVAEADLIFLSGGHVPTQNAFLNSVGMRELLQSSDKLVIGSSAGSMNAAELVYAQPEEAGEAILLIQIVMVAVFMPFVTVVFCMGMELLK